MSYPGLIYHAMKRLLLPGCWLPLLLVGCAPTSGSTHTLSCRCCSARARPKPGTNWPTGRKVPSLSSATKPQTAWYCTPHCLNTGPCKTAKAFNLPNGGLGYYRPLANRPLAPGPARGGGLRDAVLRARTVSATRCRSRRVSRITVGYIYGYLQPTVLLQADKLMAGVGLRLAQVRYHQSRRSASNGSARALCPRLIEPRRPLLGLRAAQYCKLSYRVLPLGSAVEQHRLAVFSGSSITASTASTRCWRRSACTLLWVSNQPPSR